MITIILSMITIIIVVGTENINVISSTKILRVGWEICSLCGNGAVGISRFGFAHCGKNHGLRPRSCFHKKTLSSGRAEEPWER